MAMKIKTTKNYIEDCIRVHGTRFDYSKVEYTGCFKKVIVTCRKHGDFIITASDHLKGSICIFCSGKRLFKPDLSHIVYSDGARAIPVSETKHMIVDAEDYDSLITKEWHCDERGYCGVSSSKGRKLVHRILMNVTDKSTTIDHKDRNPLNNRKSNLRLSSYAQNLYNKGPWSKSSSKYKGVWFCKSSGKWASELRCDGKRIYVGRFTNEEDAARAFDKLAIKHQGEFAYLNFPEGSKK